MSYIPGNPTQSPKTFATRTSPLSITLPPETKAAIKTCAETIILQPDRSSGLKFDSPAFQPLKCAPNAQENPYDDEAGTSFSHALHHFKRFTEESIALIQEEEKSVFLRGKSLPTPFKIEMLAYLLKEEMNKYYQKDLIKEDPETAFLIYYQICIPLRCSYRQAFFTHVLKSFEAKAFQTSPPLIKTLYDLAIVKKFSLKKLTSFLNFLSFFHLGAKKMESHQEIITRQKDPLEMSLKTVIHVKDSQFTWLLNIHLKTSKNQLTLEVNADMEQAIYFFKEGCPLAECIDFILPLLPNAPLPLPENSALQKILANNTQLSYAIDHFANDLLASANLELKIFAIELLFFKASAKSYQFSFFEINLLKTIPKLQNKKLELKPSVLLHLKTLVPNHLLLEENFHKFNSISFLIHYIKNLLFSKGTKQQGAKLQELKQQKIALELWEEEVSLQDSYASSDLLLFGDEIYQTLGSANLNPETILHAFKILRKLSESHSVGSSKLMNFFSTLYLSLHQIPGNSNSFLIFAATTLEDVIENPLDSNISDDLKNKVLNVFKTLIPQLIKDGKLDSAFTILHEALKGNWLNANEMSVDSYAIQICEHLVQKNELTSGLKALQYRKALHEAGIAGDSVNEQALIKKIVHQIHQDPQCTIEKIGNHFCKTLFEIPLNLNLFLKLRTLFFDYLKKLSFLGLTSEINHLFALQPHNFTKAEQNEIWLAGLQNEAQVSLQNLLNIDKKSCDLPSQKIITDLSKQLIPALLKEKKFDLALELAEKNLSDDLSLLIDLLTTALQEETISNKQTCHRLLNLLLTHKNSDKNQIIALINTSLTKLSPFSEEFKSSLMRLHLPFHRFFMEKKETKSVIFLLKTLLSLFSAATLYKKDPNLWLELFAHLNIQIGENPADLALLKIKEDLLKKLWDIHVFTYENRFSNYRKMCQQMITDYLNHAMNDEAIHFAIEFYKKENPHVFDKTTIILLDRLLTISITKPQDHNSLILLRTALKNQDENRDTQFSKAFTRYLNGLYKRQEHKKWIEANVEFEVSLDPENMARCGEIIISVLSRSPTTDHYYQIFKLLQKYTLQDPLVWHLFFQKIQETECENTEMLLCKELKINPTFIDIWTQNDPITAKCAIELFKIVHPRDIQTVYTLLIHHFPALSQLMTKVLTQQEDLGSYLLLSLEKCFQDSNISADQKTNLAKKIFIQPQEIKFAADKQQWLFSKIMFKHGVYEKDLKVYFSSCKMLLESCDNNPSFLPLLKPELSRSILQLFKSWPEINETHHDTLYEVIFSKPRTYPILNKTPLEQFADRLILKIYDLLCDDFFEKTCFEEFKNLIGKKSESLQLFALTFYEMSITLMQNPKNKQMAFGVVPPKTTWHDLLLFALQTNHPSVVMKTIELFNRPAFQEDLREKKKHSLCAAILQKLIQHPSKSCAASDQIGSVCKVFFTYFSKPYLKSIKNDYFNYLININARILSELNDIESFLQNQDRIFLHLQLTYKAHSIDPSSAKAPHLLMLATTHELILNDISRFDIIHPVIVKQMKQLLQVPSVALQFLFDFYVDYAQSIQHLINYTTDSKKRSQYAKAMVQFCQMLLHSSAEWSPQNLSAISQDLSSFNTLA